MASSSCSLHCDSLTQKDILMTSTIRTPILGNNLHQHSNAKYRSVDLTRFDGKLYNGHVRLKFDLGTSVVRGGLYKAVNA